MRKVPVSNKELNAPVQTLDEVYRHNDITLASRICKATNARVESREVDMRAGPSHKVIREDARCKDAIQVVPGDAAHSHDYAPGFVMPEQRQVAARVKDSAVPRNGSKTQSPGGQKFLLKRTLVVSLRYMAMDATTSFHPGAIGAGTKQPYEIGSGQDMQAAWQDKIEP